MNSSMSSRYWKIILPLLIIIAGLAVLPQVVAAQGGPPPAAIAACENKSQGDACEFTASSGATITGACLVVQDVLACVPGDPPTETPSATSPTPSATPTATPASSPSMLDYTIVDTGQTGCYSDAAAISCPSSGAAYYGQDAQHAGVQPSYQDNGDGTVTDLNTGLMWQQTPDSEKSTFAEAVAGAAAFDLAGYDDWRLPTIKELYSLIDFNGNIQPTIAASTPYIDTDYFDFEYGDESAGERIIDAQYWSSTEYVGTTMGGNATTFGVNFADGRIKGYGSGGMTQFVRYVRANPSYGVNNFDDNPLTGPGQAGTITDLATGLMWQGADSGATYNWDGALGYCNDLSLAGHDDWRLPNAKELQSIVDYTRAPDAQDPAQQSAAIDPIFNVTSDDVYFWSSTTHMDGPNYWGAYVAFGEAWGYMEQPPDSGAYVLLNVHGAGAQRSDPKVGDPADWPNGNGPQGDVVRIYNYARCVRDADTVELDRPYKLFIPLAMREAEASSNNGAGARNYSSVDEIIPPVDAVGNYTLDAGSAYGPAEPVWTYTADVPTDFYAERVSGAQRLAGGNTLICDGPSGVFFEVTPEKETVWTYDYGEDVFRVVRYESSYAGLLPLATAHLTNQPHPL